MNVAIIGAGVSGLLTAYLLKQQQPQAAVTLFEKCDRIGGNARTARFNWGRRGEPARIRWADLGVNDLNTVTYKNITKLMDQLGVSYHPLEDSASFSTQDGSISYVIDAGYQAGSRTATTMPVMVQKGFDNFAKQAPIDATDTRFQEMSIAAYIAYRNRHNPERDPEFYPQAYVKYNLYPRINGMYFAHDSGPDTMSFAGVMRYYALQEGLGGPPPQRVYIEGGSETWIDALSRKIQSQGVKIVLNAAVQVLGHTQGADLMLNSQHRESFDAVVMACHASTALKLIRQGMTNEMVQVLSQFEHYNSVAVAHTYAAVLPPDPRNWRTYNILIRGEGPQLRPYSISYVCNRHQNDANNPDYQQSNEPEFFVTLNPAIPIPPELVLQQLDGTPAVKPFTHNIVSTETLRAQQQLWGTQGNPVQGQNHIYFVGGWTQGAGLHEECFQAAQGAVNFLLGKYLNRTFMKSPDLSHPADINSQDRDVKKEIARI